jgi:hypothetical protein
MCRHQRAKGGRDLSHSGPIWLNVLNDRIDAGDNWLALGCWRTDADSRLLPTSFGRIDRNDERLRDIPYGCNW